jgi:HD-like signal output (HDOD) protein
VRWKLPWHWFRRRSEVAQPERIVETAVGPPRDPQPAEQAALGADLLDNNRVDTAELGELAKLPPFRPVALSLLRLFDRPQINVREIAAMVESDPTMASEMLAVVNSPLFAFRQTVSRTSHAIILLGAERTKSLAATLAMRSLIAGGPRMPIVRRFWVHSIATATIARHFAMAFRTDPELSHVTALLHDLGRNGLLAAYPERYARLAVGAYENAAEILSAEQAEFGMTHCYAGTLLARAWHLPDSLQTVAGHHHETISDRPLVSLVQLSCRLADDLMYQAIYRADIQKPEATIEQYVTGALRRSLIDQLEPLTPAIDTAIKSLDF